MFNVRDEIPQITVSNIKQILLNYGINTYEESLNPSPLIHSHIIGIDGLCVTHSGKGSSEEFSLASAYAELIERLSNHMLGRSPFSDLFYYKDKDFIFFPDTYKRDILEIGNINKFLLDELRNNFYLSDGRYPSDDDLINVWGKILNNELHMSPFYNVREDRIEELPYNIIDTLCGPNGIAAGNTYEEAVVHCICEIIERYMFSQVIDNPFSFPEIPMEYIKKHSKNAYKMISCIEQNKRYKVYTLDVSMNGKFPCCASILIDRQTQKYKFKIGCHPIFTIALERSLTEIMQRHGTIESTLCNQVEWNSFTEENTKTYQNKCSYFRNSLGSVSNILFKREKDFEFKEWTDQENYSTKLWAKKLINLCLDLFDNVYIRNNSWLGFPVIRMYIPKITEITVIPKGYNNEYEEEIFYILKELNYYAYHLTDEYKMFLLNKLITEDNVFVNFLSNKNYTIASLYYYFGDKEKSYEYLCKIVNPSEEIKIIKRDLELELKKYSLDDRNTLIQMFFPESLYSFLLRWRNNSFLTVFNGVKDISYIEKPRIDVVNFTKNLKDKISNNIVNQFVFRELLKGE